MLTVQQLDKRMTGHEWFKYRVEFKPGLINEDTGAGALPNKIRDTFEFYNLCGLHFTQAFGYGPDIEKVHVYVKKHKEPKWGYRTANNLRYDSIYLKDDEARAEYEKLVTFWHLSRG